MASPPLHSAEPISEDILSREIVLIPHKTALPGEHYQKASFSCPG